MATSSSVPGILDLEWPEGDSVSFTFTFQDELANPIDLSGNTFYAEFRNRQSSATGHLFSVDDANANVGVIVITTPTGTNLPNVGVWDLRFKDGLGAVTSLLSGKTSLRSTVSDTT